MDGEIKAFLDNFKILNKMQWKSFDFYLSKFGNNEIVITKTGVGKTLSAMVTQKLIDLFDPSAFIFTGIAGSLNNELNVGDILIGRDSIQHDMDSTHFNFKRGEIPQTSYRFFKSDNTLFQAAISYKSKDHKVIAGRVLTGDQFITESKSGHYSYLVNDLHGDCVEMEGASVALVSIVNNIPHIIIRTISDKADVNEKIDIREFLKTASDNSLQIVKHILSKM